MAPRRRRNLGAPLYAYNTDSAEETGNWEEWQMAPTGPVCSRTCGGGVMIETRVITIFWIKKKTNVSFRRNYKKSRKIKLRLIFLFLKISRAVLGQKEAVLDQPKGIAHVILVSAHHMQMISEKNNVLSTTTLHSKENDMNGFLIWKHQENVS